MLIGMSLNPVGKYKSLRYENTNFARTLHQKSLSLSYLSVRSYVLVRKSCQIDAKAIWHVFGSMCAAGSHSPDIVIVYNK